MVEDDKDEFVDSLSRDSDGGGEEEQRTVHHFKERVSGKEYDLVIEDYIEDHNYDRVPHIRSNRDVDQIKILRKKFTVTSRCRNIIRHATDAFTVISSCFLSFTISNHEPFLSAVLAQAVVATIALAAFPELAGTSGVGAFAGMATSDAIINYGYLCLLSIIVSIVWFIFNHYKLLIGFGVRRKDWHLFFHIDECRLFNSDGIWRSILGIIC
jgi:hypothetical protein